MLEDGPNECAVCGKVPGVLQMKLASRIGAMALSSGEMKGKVRILSSVAQRVGQL
jgi:hypothetical protein